MIWGYGHVHVPVYPQKNTELVLLNGRRCQALIIRLFSAMYLSNLMLQIIYLLLFALEFLDFVQV